MLGGKGRWKRGLAPALATIALLSLLTANLPFVEGADTTPPSVVSVSPRDGATAVPVTATVQVVFSEKMDTTSVESVFSLSGAQQVQGTFKWKSKSACEFTPSQSLEPGVSYLITQGAGAKDAQGLAMTQRYSSQFLTESRPSASPYVIECYPTNGASDLSPSQISIQVFFSEAMDPASVESAFSLTGGGINVQGGFSWTSSSSCTFAPSIPLAFGTAYIIAVGAGAKDVQGASLLSAFSSGFVTGSQEDTAPRVLGTEPSDGATGVDLKSTISIAFSQSMDKAAVENAFNLSAGGLSVAGTFDPWSDGDKIMTFRPSGSLNESAAYQIKVNDAAKAADGKQMSNDFSSKFTTRRLKDTSPPSISCPESIANSSKGILFKIQDEADGWGIEWNFLRVKDNGVDATPCLVVNETDGNVTLPPPNIVGSHTIEIMIEDMAGNEAAKVCTVEVILSSEAERLTDPSMNISPQLNCTPTAGKVMVSWITTSPSCCPGPPKCIIYRGKSPESLSPLVMTMGNAYIDNSVMNGQQYYYSVRAIFEKGEGAPSLVVEATPSIEISTGVGDLSADPMVAVGALVFVAVLGLTLVMLVRRQKRL